MRPDVSVITLGVRDFARARRFYAEGLGWPVLAEQGDWAAFALGAGGTVLALYPWDALADDAAVPAEGSGFRGVTLAYNVGSEARVDEVLAEAERAGAAVVRKGAPMFWGGYSGYFADPEGVLWEVATGAAEMPRAE